MVNSSRQVGRAKLSKVSQPIYVVCPIRALFDQAAVQPLVGSSVSGHPAVLRNFFDDGWARQTRSRFQIRQGTPLCNTEVPFCHQLPNEGLFVHSAASPSRRKNPCKPWGEWYRESCHTSTT